MQSRVPMPPESELTPAQRKLRDDILATRGNLDGPFIPWLASPELGDRAQALGAQCRYGTSLALPESEMLILVVAARLQCLGEWQIHAPIAARAGVAAQAITAIERREAARFDDARMQVLHDTARALLDTNRVPEDLYQAAVATLGLRTVVDAVGVLGYYALAAFTLNAFEVSIG
jgi:4-carboxymuconolactone decarboxylase